MRSPASPSALAAAGLAVALVVAGCGSGGEDAASSAPPETSAAESSAAGSPPAAAADGQTVAEYLTANGVTQTLVTRGDAEAPELGLPMPEGWADVGGDIPKDAYGAIYLAAAKGTPNPPAIIARMARLEGGTFDPAEILDLAPNALTRLPGWSGPDAGNAGTLDGFDATAIAGRAQIDGAPTFVARKTVVIPGREHTYLLALDAQGPINQQQALTDAMAVIDEETTIKP
ncbi:hypothetical protein FHR72_001372 [Mycolicibacterium iranicum]|uniref:Lipoprotein LpqN n=1 Tax=Mycolicibacterium iranicum TaxID=912594 RepID=A0A839Q250_MYCIR|nr:LpqN/LpqT family lipoprotein [Mycolicibacterium iranicum]MBB2989909.1 hypothetical protein [Mycolicibacterium iranicum]